MSARIDLPEAEWRRVSPKYIVVDLVGTLIVAAIFVGVASVFAAMIGQLLLWTVPAALATIFLIVLALTPRRVRAIGYALREDDLLFRKGIMFQRIVAVPYGRMQLVDITRGPVARAVGLSELKFVTAAATTNVVLPGLPQEVAEELRDQFIGLAESRRAGL